MEQVLTLLVVLVGVTHAADTKCNATQNTSVCSAALGGSVYIQVMTNASGHHLRCKKQLSSGSINVFSLNKEKVNMQEAFRDKAEFFIYNGTLKIMNVERNDSGQYFVEVFDLNGVLVRNIHVKLDVQESSLSILIPVCSALGVLLIIVLIACCLYRKVGRHKTSSSGMSLESKELN